MVRVRCLGLDARAFNCMRMRVCRCAGNVIQDGFSLGEGYYENTIPIVEMQLAKGGLRLAGLLNNMWSSNKDIVADT